MIARNTHKEELQLALEKINHKYDGNVIWNRSPDQTDKRGLVWKFTLRVRNSRGAGASISSSGRHSTSACWHVHGDFFDALFEINPNAIVVARGRKITKDFGNWSDYNIGSVMSPFMASEGCEGHS